MPTVAFLHTAAVHIPTFRALARGLSPDVRQIHAMRPDWLETARVHGVSEELTIEMSEHLSVQLDSADAVLCTCSTLGPIADAMNDPRILRIDRPMMERAAETPGAALVAFCLQSTSAPTLSLLDAAYAAVGRHPERIVCDCGAAWSEFEAGNTDRFAATIASCINKGAAEAPGLGCVVLAQASMACAEPLLADLGVPVLSSPRLAVSALLAAS